MALSNHSKSGLENSQDEHIVSDINMTPLIDIMLVLLIIFMVTSSLTINNGLDVNLPNSKTPGNNNQQSEGITVSLTKSGQILVQGQSVSLETLKENISNELKQRGTDQIIFEGDELSTLGQAMEIMDLAKAAGAKNFAIATELNDLPK